MTARLAKSDSEIVGEEDNGGPSKVHWQSPFWRCITLYLPSVRLDYTLSVTVLYVFIAIFSVGRQLGKLSLLNFSQAKYRILH